MPDDTGPGAETARNNINELRHMNLHYGLAGKGGTSAGYSLISLSKPLCRKESR
jgi:hypothetical protein